ncbi:MAG: hypothetical protein C4551_10065 [Bacillota bacterium]|jgi:hypothetical protein|nr:MAG: hypothetical protein C4551_10065 [Bacillota bacterium]
MSQPALLSQLALSTRPTEAPTKIDVTGKIRGPIHIRRGRSHPREPFQAGTYSGVLDNQDRRFDPTFAGEIENYCKDPTFERGVGSIPGLSSGWTRWLSSSELNGQITFLQDIGTPRGVGYSQCVLTMFPLSGLTATRRVTVMETEYASTVPGDSWSLKATLDVSVISGCAIRIVIQIRQADDTLVGEYGSSSLTAVTGDWVMLEVLNVVAPVLSAKVRAMLDITNLDNGDTFTVRIDDVQLQSGPTVTHYPVIGGLDNCRWAGAAHNSYSYYGGPYYGNLKPTRRLWQSAVWAGVTYPMFAGYVDGWPPAFEVGDFYVTLTATDGFKVLAKKILNKAYAEQLSSERVNEVLDDIGWTTGDAWVLDSLSNSQLGTSTILAPTSGDRYVMLGKTTVQAQTFTASDKVDALAHLQDVEKAEYGQLFMGREGALYFRDRHYLLRPDHQTPKAIFGDGGGDELPYVDFEPSYDDSELYNEVVCQRKNGAAQTASDGASKFDHFARTLPDTDLLAASDSEMADRANWLLARRKDPQWRIKTIVLDPEGDDRLWPIVLGTEIGDRYTIRRRPGGGALIEADYEVQCIEVLISEEFRWQFIWTLWPSDPTKYWHVTNGDDEFAPYAVLGETTVLGY